MRFFGLTLTREKAAGGLSTVDNRGGWWPIVKESFAGAWQHNVEVRQDSVLANHAVFACETLIAGDIAKLRVKLVQKDSDGIWSETASPAYSPVLRKPNHFQTRIQFFESWVLSKLQRGNAYILKQRDNRGVVTGLYVLNPDRVTPLVATDGSVYYDLKEDHLSGTEGVVVPAREIIHDRYNCLFHPLVGLSPIFANGLAATQGIAIQNTSTRLFQNGARPGGILTAPGNIEQSTADRLKAYWDSSFTGENAGKVAVLGDGLKYEAMTVDAVDAQLVEQLKWSAEMVAGTYHIPPYKVGIGSLPSYNNVQALNVDYYTQALQRLIEDIELCLDEGLGIGDGVSVNGNTYGTEFDIDGLLRMDSAAMFEVLAKAKDVETLDERRRRIDRKPVAGGGTIYMQQQDHSLEAIAARDAALISQANNPTVQPAPAADPAPPANDNAEAARALLTMMKGLA